MKKILISSLLLLIALPILFAQANTKYATVFNPDTGHRKQVVVGDKNAFVGGYLLELNYLEEQKLGYSVVSAYKTTLRSSMTSVQSTVPVSSIETPDGHTITMDDLGSKVFLTIEAGNAKQEIVMCTGISSTNFTGCTRGLAFHGSSTVSVAENRKTHSSGSTVIMSNVHYAYEELMDKDSEESIVGNKSFYGNTYFDNFPTATSSIPTSNYQLANKFYVDTVGAGGFTSLNASTTKGLEVYGTAPETVGVNLDETKGLAFDAGGQLYVKASSTKNIAVDSNGLYFNGANDLTVTATTTLATTTVSQLNVTTMSVPYNTASTSPVSVGLLTDNRYYYAYDVLAVDVGTTYSYTFDYQDFNGTPDMVKIYAVDGGDDTADVTSTGIYNGSSYKTMWTGDGSITGLGTSYGISTTAIVYLEWGNTNNYRVTGTISQMSATSTILNLTSNSTSDTAFIYFLEAFKY